MFTSTRMEVRWNEIAYQSTTQGFDMQCITAVTSFVPCSCAPEYIYTRAKLQYLDCL